MHRRSVGSVRAAVVIAGLCFAVPAFAGPKSAPARGEKPVVRAETSTRRIDLPIALGLTLRIEVPYGFVANDALSAQASDAVRIVGGAARLPIRGEARAFATTTRDAVLVVTWVERETHGPVKEAPLHAREFVTDFKKKLKRGMIGAKVIIDTATENIGKRLAETRIEWSVKKQKLRGVTRAQAVALAATGFHGVQVQCVFLDGAEKTRRSACEKAAASLTLAAEAGFLLLDGSDLPDPGQTREPNEAEPAQPVDPEPDETEPAP